MNIVHLKLFKNRKIKYNYLKNIIIILMPRKKTTNENDYEKLKLDYNICKKFYQFKINLIN